MRSKRVVGSPLAIAFRAAFFVFLLTIVVLEFPGFHELETSPHDGIDTRNLVIQDVLADGPNTGKDIQPGDEIYSVAGERVRNQIHYLSILASNKDASPRQYVLLRGTKRITVTIEYTHIPPARLYKHFSFLLVAFALILVGSWVLLRRPDRLGSLFGLNCAFLAFFLTHRPAVDSPTLQLAGELIHDAVMLLFPAVFFHFFLVFPDRDRSVTPLRRSRRTWVIYLLPVLVYLVTAAMIVARFHWIPIDRSLVMGVMTLSLAYYCLYIVASLVMFIRSYRGSPPAGRQKLRVVIAGTFIGILPLLVTSFFRHLIPGESDLIDLVTALCLGLVPVTFAYAILKHGAIALNTVVRKGIVYAFLSGGIVAAYYLLVLSVGDIMMREFNLTRTLFIAFSVLLLAMLFAPARARLQRFVDHLFYRGDYVYKQEVFEFNRQLARKLTKEEIYASFSDRVEAILNSSFIAVYAHQGTDHLRLERVTGGKSDLPPSFPLYSFLGRYLSRFTTPLLVEFLDRSWERPRIDAESRSFLEISGLAVCVPVVAHGDFLSLILLGEKRSGLAHTQADVELLGTFAEQLALVLQNADLLAASIEKERLKNEVMLARDIQISLLPASPPHHPRLEILGQMVSSNEVGGDYFDYFPLDDHRIAVAIGDVSGKGIPAAMLMSSLQAVFTNLAAKAKLPPAEVNAGLNEYLIDYGKTEQFATFFYGIIDLLEGRFTFSNAGQCPTLLVKHDYVDRLGQGGLLLGVEPSARYREGNVAIEPGDLILLYTDGVSEQKAPGGEEYGEARLIDFLNANKNLPIRELQSALFDDVLAFGDGNQDDDLTTVFAYYKGA